MPASASAWWSSGFRVGSGWEAKTIRWGATFRATASRAASAATRGSGPWWAQFSHTRRSNGPKCELASSAIVASARVMAHPPSPRTARATRPRS